MSVSMGREWSVSHHRRTRWILMGTPSKALGSYGGYIAGKRSLIEILKGTAPAFIFAAGIPPTVVATGASTLAIKLSKYLRENGVLAAPITYPAVDETKSRTRFFICSIHSFEQLEYTANLIIKFLSEISNHG